MVEKLKSKNEILTREKNELEDQLKRAKQDAENQAAVKDGESALNKRVTELT